jgi:hypothetical protein
LICDCSSNEHQIIITKFTDETDIDVEVYGCVHLKRLPFLKRLHLGIGYIFGRKSKYGNFEEFIFNESHIPQLENIIKYLQTKNNE